MQWALWFAQRLPIPQTWEGLGVIPNRILVPPKLGKCLKQNAHHIKEQKDSEMVPVIALWSNSA